MNRHEQARFSIQTQATHDQRCLGFITGSLCLLMPLKSQAQQQVADVSTRLFGEKTEVTVGLGAAYTPRYLGAKQSRAMLVPTLSIYRGIFFADSMRGLGAEYLTQSGFTPAWQSATTWPY